MRFEITLLSSKLSTPTILKLNAFHSMLAFSVDFFKQARYKKGWDNGTKCEMASVKKQAFIFKIAGVHSSFERRVDITLQCLKNTEFSTYCCIDKQI